MPSHGEQIYNSLVSSLGGNYAVAPGSRQDAWCYALAMGAARAWYAMERGGNQAWAAHIGELLAVKEAEYGIIPGPNDTIAERHAVLAARMLAPVAGTYGNIVAALTALLGDDFIEYRPTDKADAVMWPTTCGAQPMNLQLETVPRHLLELIDPPTIGLGGPCEVEYRLLDPEPLFDATTSRFSSPVEVGEVLVLEPANLTLSERVTVTAVRRTDPENPFLTQFFFTAIITKPHHPGDLATSMPWPLWVSDQANSLIIVTEAAALDPEKRRKVHDLMGRMAKGVSTWSITAAPNEFTLTSGPWRAGDGRMDVTTIGAL